MKIASTYFILIFACSSNAQSIKLNYEPSGQIIKLCFDSLTVYTDTNSLFEIFWNDTSPEGAYAARVRDLIRKQFNEGNSDTAYVSGTWFVFEDSDPKTSGWYVLPDVVRLTERNKLKIIDKNSETISRIITKKVGNKKQGYVFQDYLNKDTKEILFSRNIYSVSITPRF